MWCGLLALTVAAATDTSSVAGGTRALDARVFDTRAFDSRALGSRAHHFGANGAAELETASSVATAINAGTATTATETGTAAIDAAAVAASTDTATAAAEADDGPLRYAKYAALVDGGWSIALTVAWGLSARVWDAPYPEGITAIAFARILYGTSWTFLVAADVALIRAFAGEDWSGISKGAFKNHWLVGLDVPGRCSDRNSENERGPCGVGLGSFGEISARVSSEYPIRAALTGGWIQGRYADNSERTLMESTWIQAPLSIWYEPRFELGPVALELSFGPGWFWGMHNAHVHLKPGVKLPRDRAPPFYEMIPLHYGTGPGGHAAVGLVFFDAVALVAEADVAAFILGGSNEDALAKVAPLTVFDARGMPLYRKYAAGLRFTLDALHPLILSAKVMGVELSPRALDRAGHLAAGLQFEVPMDLQKDEEDEAD